MARRRSRWRIPILVLVFAALAIGCWRLWTFLAIDDCLDAGGAWDYDVSHCAFDYQPSPP